jgi:predicted dithiol-disulfide oxidoreductase (DUF899 family)
LATPLRREATWLAASAWRPCGGCGGCFLLADQVAHLATISDDFGADAFLRDGERICRTYFVNDRGDEAMGSTWSYLGITALGRQEDWEDSPEG